MPTFEFTSPEGKKYRVDGPEGATQEQAFAILQQQLGTQAQTPSTKKRGAVEEIGRQVGLTTRYGIEGATAGAGMLTDPVINAIGGAVRAVTGSDYDPVTLAKIGQSVANALGLPQPETEQERVVGAVTRGVAGAAAPTALAGQVAKATTGTTQKVAQQLAAQPSLQMAAGGSAAGAGQAAAEAGASPGAQLAAALGAGIAAPMALAGAGKIASLRSATISPEQQAIIASGEAAGVPILTSDVLPPKTFMGKQAQAVGERIPIAGTGGLRQAQQEARQEAVSKLAQTYGAPSYEAIVSSVKGKVGAIKSAAGRVIDKTGQKLDAAGPVAPSQSLQAIDDAITKLSQPNVYNPGRAAHIRELEDLKEVLASGQQTFTTLRQSRTAVRDMLDSVDAAGRSQLPSYPKKLVTQVYNAMKADMDSFAAANLSPAQMAKLTRANRVYGDEAALLRQSRLKNVLDKGEMTPEVVRNMIYSNKPSENKILYESLGTAGRQQVKAALIDDAAAKALRNGEVNPNAFGAELAKHDKKIDVFFKGEEREAIKGLIRLMQVTKRAQDAAAAPTTTGATVLPYALGGAAIVDLGTTVTAAVSAGRLARLYESKPVRDLLLKLANSNPRSSREAGYVRGLLAAMREGEPERQARRPQSLTSPARPALPPPAPVLQLSAPVIAPAVEPVQNP